MKDLTYDEQFARLYIRDIEVTKDYKEVVSFFQLQEELMRAVLASAVSDAEKVMKKLQETLHVRAPLDLHVALPRFYLTQIALFTNEIKKFGISPLKIFCFSSASIEIIYSWKTESELIEGGKWLVGHLIDMINERLHPLFNHPLVRQAAEYINRHLETAIEVDAVAKKLDISPSYLAKLFKQEAGMTVKQFSNSRKVSEAKYYLQYSSRDIAEISEQFSFCNQSYFTKVFKEQIGMTPKQFRLSLERKPTKVLQKV
ncbi:helix-turn-helix domain-containing protein [Jeotgalibacillus proteolyticus]|uniref:HTH araC/xylS-type domain-containing protein n=1 Tax=Jeotgalibacillus proteolyticus TaxID=2082395 RepID=A0A2S5GA34_9BACL|nr:AraC family transcriptional regulator [Jeotgalibacillus proteolyticus]PPA69781.1 hypothetical protein C4B60_14690 [Jeotgalibacillus proteolyticus]